VQHKRNKLVTAAGYARLRNLNRSTVSRQVKSGLIPIHDGGLIDPAEADRARERNLDPAKVAAADVRKHNPSPTESRTPLAEVKPTGDPDAAVDDDVAAGTAPEDYWAVRTRHEKAKADRAELDLAAQQGKLLDAEVITSHWAALGTLVRDVVMSIPSRVVNRLPDEWRRQVSLIVTEETRRALSAISHELSQPAK